ncbi:MAG TPA: carboxypeptidase regulatory-like domain-containing protein [Pyrinomonadaceae bacterium]|nr:carboxypeptidase regulatory-like domain-containing protein [Pyrinomonadaceae bacterium]
MIQKIKFLPAMLALLLCLTATAFAQETGGAIEGTISDPQGNVVPGVTVTITSRGVTEGARPDATTGLNRTATTDENGFFRVQEVPPGFYTVRTAPASGFQTTVVESVEVVLGKTTPVRVTLSAGNVSETVTVTSDAVAIDPTDTKIQTNITSQVAELLPKGTNFTTLLQTAPAVRNEPLAGGFQVDGASGSENTFIIDGQEVTNFRTGTLNANNNVPFQFVQEVQVKSSGFEAEFGGASGGVINVVTKGGSNEWHGEFGLTLRPAELQAIGRPTLRLFRQGSTAAGNFFQNAEQLNDPRDRATDFFPTANFSGPILRDRLWFFASYTPQFNNAIQDINYISSDPRGRVPRFTETYRANTRAHYAFTRLDASVTDKLRLTGTFTYNPIEYNGLLPPATQQISNPAVANFGGTIGTLTGSQLLGQQGGRVNANNFTGKMDYTPTDRLVISVRGGRSFLNEKARPADGVFSYGIPRQQRFICATGSTAGGCATGFQNFPSNNAIDFDVSIRKTFDADASYLVNDFAGRHQFKFGYQYNGISNDVSSGYAQFGITQLFYGTNIVALSGDASLTPTPGNLGSGLFQRVSTNGKASSNSQTFFIQDQYQPINRLTFNIGARFEKETVPSFINNLPGIEFGYGDKIAPRLGVAYDLTGDGKTKLFGFYGWFYDRFKYELPRGSFGGDFFRVDYFEILPDRANFMNYTLANILGNRPDQQGGNCPNGGITGGTGFSRCQLDFRIPSNIPGVPIEVGGGIDPDLKPHRQSEFTVGAERDLGSGFLFSGRYTHKQIDRAVEDIGFFNAEGSENYIIGNPGFGASVSVLQSLGFPATPKAERDYDALELRIDKRFTRRYYFNASYTLSRLYGNYPGLASSDEAGRNSPNVNRLFDLPFIQYTAAGVLNNGRLPTDRPHVFKFSGAYTLDWAQQLGFGAGNSTEFSTFTQVASGTPQTTRFDFEGVTSTILFGRGDLGRTERFTQTDFGLRHKYRFGSNERFTMVFDVDVLNLFNENNILGLSQLINARLDFAGETPGDTDTDIVNAFIRGEVLPIVQETFKDDPSLVDANYRQPNNFQTGRSVRFGFRLLF